MSTTVREAVANVSTELGSLVELTLNLQDYLSTHGGSEGHIVEFQALDWLTQSLSCLKVFLEDLQADVEPSSVVTEGAFDKICLSRLRDRLCGKAEGEPLQAREECELF